MVTERFARALAEHIEAGDHGYQAQISRETGVSTSMINRIKGRHIDSSEHVETLARYCGLPLPPLDLEEEEMRMLSAFHEVDPDARRAMFSAVMGIYRGWQDDQDEFSEEDTGPDRTPGRNQKK